MKDHVQIAAETPFPEPGPDLQRAYQRYFGTGAYDRRYPEANPLVLARIRSCLQPGGHVIDFGCGSGRYLFPLRRHAGRVAGFDICPDALSLLQRKAAATGWSDLALLGPDPGALTVHAARHGPADVVLCLFGVLGHIVQAEERQAALRRMRSVLKPGTGRLILSVPNRWRRFYREQVQHGEDGCIRYHRQMAGSPVEMHYQLFDPSRLGRELAMAGFRLLRLEAESILSESLVARSASARITDRLIRHALPAWAGYGLLATAVPEEGAR